MRLSVEITIDAPADAVWDIVGRGFDEIGTWASTIRSSRPADAGAEETPRQGHERVCETGLRMAPQVRETLVAYDDGERTFSYEGSGLPSFVTLARNRWRVTALSENRCVVRLDATLELRGAAASLLAPALRIQFLRQGRRLARDLRHYAEHGSVSPQKHASTRRARSRLHASQPGP